MGKRVRVVLHVNVVRKRVWTRGRKLAHTLDVRERCKHTLALKRAHVDVLN